MEPLIVGCDFDGTVVEHKYPDIGPQIGRSVEIITELRLVYGIKFVLWTVRSGEDLVEAMNWLHWRTCFFDGYNTQYDANFVFATKLYCHYFIDDRNIDWRMGGNDGFTAERWEQVRTFLISESEKISTEQTSGQSDDSTEPIHDPRD